MYGLRIILAEYDPVFRREVKDMLQQAGCNVVAETDNGRTALHLTYNIQPDLLIINTQLPGRDGLEVAKIIEEQRVAPVILISEDDRQDELKQLLGHWMVAYLLKPLDVNNLFPVIETYLAMFKRICRLEEDNRKLKQTLESRKFLERAKGLLVERKGMTEEQAFKYIQKASMDKCMSMQNVAKLIIKLLENYC